MNNIRKYRKKIGIKQTELCKMIGVSQGALSGWETGRYEPDIKSLDTMAKLFGVSVDELLGREEQYLRFDPSHNWIPVLGNVAAGIPMEAIEDFDCDDPDAWEQIDDSMARNGKHIALRINGDSMEPRMKKGDVVIVRLQETIENGEIAVVSVNGDDATCKKIKKTPQGLTLISLNPAYAPMFYTAEECAELPVAILGKVVELRAKF